MGTPRSKPSNHHHESQICHPFRFGYGQRCLRHNYRWNRCRWHYCHCWYWCSRWRCSPWWCCHPQGTPHWKSLSKGKRSAEGSSDDEVFLVLNNAEPAQCYRRLICDMAAGAIPDQDKILSLFNTEVSPVSPKFDYVNAAKVGKLVKNASMCEVRYSCPLSTQEIAKIF